MEANEIRLEAQDLNQQGVMLLKTGNREAAMKKFDKAIELDPMLMDSYKNYGDLYMSAGEYMKAKNVYKKAILIEKKGELYFLYGNACFMNDEVHEGLEYYNLAISAGFDNDEMMFFMGMAYEHLNDDGMALRYFQKACAKNPSRPDYLVKKISSLIRQDMIDSAEESTEELLKTAPELYDGYHIKTQLLLHKDDLKAAMEFAKSASERFPEDSDLMFDYVKCVALNDDMPEALKLLESAKKMKYFEDSKPEFTLLEAQIQADMQNTDLAIQCCEECITLETADFFASEARFMLMNLHLIKPDFEKALEQATKIVARDSEDAYYYAALYYKPFCLSQLGKDDEAQKGYREANSIYRLATLQNPAAIDVYLYRAMCLKDMKEYDKAMELLDFISGLDSSIAEIYTIRAEIYHATGMEVQAEKEMEKAYAIKPELKPSVHKDGE